MEGSTTFYLILTFLLILGFLDVSFKGASKPYWCIPLAFILVYVSTFHRFGNDTQGYINFYNEFPPIKNFGEFFWTLANSRYEKGFLFCIMLFKKIGLGYLSFFAFVSAVSVTGMLFVFRAFSHTFLLSTMIYTSSFYLWNEHVQIRQGVASSMVLLAIYFYSRKSLFRFFEMSVLAFTWHFASAVSLFFHPLKKAILAIRVRASLMLIALAGFSLLYGSKLVLVEVAPLLPQTVVNYLTYSPYSFAINFFSLKVLKGMLISSAIFILWDEHRENDLLHNLCLLYLFGFMLQLIFLDFYIMGLRLAQVFMISEPVVIAFIARRLFKGWAVIPVFAYCSLNVLKVFIN